MNKLFLIAIPIVLLISGCTIPEERLVNLEKKLNDIENNLSFYGSRLDSLENRQNAIENSYKEFTAKKTETPLSDSPLATDTSLGVQNIQTALKNAGFYNGAIDGRIGPDTDKAIRSFQEANGLKVDGIVGAKTRSLLAKYLTQDTD